MTITTPASAQWLNDGTAPVTVSGYGKVGGAVRTIDLGSDTIPYHGVVAFNTSALYLISDQVYLFELVGSTTEDFSGDVQALATWSIRAAQQDVRPFSNVHDGVVYQYVRHRMTLSGATPSITSLSFIKSLGDLDTYSIAELISIQVLLCSSIKDAATMFRAWMTGVAWGGPNSDGKYALSDGLGNIVYMKCPAQLQAESSETSPFYYGAIGDGASHPASGFYDTLDDLQVKYPWATSLYQEMDWLGFQAWIYAGGGSCKTSNFVLFNNHVESQTPIIAASGTFDATGHGSKLLVPYMIEQTDDTEYLLNSDFSSGSAWSNATIFSSTNILMTTFGSGYATMTDTGNPGTGQKTYYNWGQQITLLPGRYTMTATCEATLGDSYALGNFDPGYANISFSALSPGEGGNPIGRSSGGRFNLSPDHPADTKLLSTDFQVDTTITVWATFDGGGYANIKCSKFSIKKWLPNCVILATRDGSPDHFPLPRGFDGFEIVGPTPYTHSGVSAVRYKSFSNTDGNIVRFTNCMIHDFGRGMSFGDGAYLNDFENVNIYGCGRGLYSELGTKNAGENIRMYGGGIANCLVGIDGQGGFEFSLFGTALDYCYQSAVNVVGRIELHGVHMETHAPVEADKPIFHLIGGQVTMHGGMILLTDTPLTAACAPIKSEFSTAIFECFGTELYNLSSSPAGAGKGAMMEGPGQFVTHGWRNSGNPNIGPLVVSYAPVMDALGGAGKFPAPNPWTADKSGILLEGGNFPDPPPQIPITASIAGSRITISTPPAFAVAEGMQIKGAGIKGVPLLSFIPGTGGTGYAGDYLSSIPQNVPSGPMTAGYDGQIDRWNTIYGTLEWSDDYMLDDSNCVKFTKGISATGINSALRFLIPATPRSVSLGFVNFLFPVDYSPVDPTETVPLYYRLFWVRSLGHDDYGRPIIGKEWFAGSTTLNVPRAGSLDWQLRSLLTTYKDVSADAATETSTHSPEGATHLGIYLDTQSLPDGQVFYMANLIDNLLR